MRPSLPLRERRQHGRTARRSSGPATRARDYEGRAATAPAPAADLREDLLGPDMDFERARLAGGPEDVAHYSCTCGLLFEADVSTTVACPHCGAAQAW